MLMNVMVVFRRAARVCIFALFALQASWVMAAEDIPFLTYHDAPPFIIDSETEKGLTYDLARWLSKNSGGKYRFVVGVVPRKRLDAMLGQPRPIVVPWVIPAWFEGVWIQNQYWTTPVLEDRNVLVSRSGNFFEYTGPDSLSGKTVSGLRGGAWVGLDPLVEAGKISRIDAPNYFLAIKLVLNGRADVAMVPEPVARFFVEKEKIKGALHFSQKPHSSYMRRMLVSERIDVFQYLEVQVPKMVTDAAWQAAIAKIGL